MEGYVYGNNELNVGISYQYLRFQRARNMYVLVIFCNFHIICRKWIISNLKNLDENAYSTTVAH
jgi:hypothetical protein